MKFRVVTQVLLPLFGVVGIGYGVFFAKQQTTTQVAPQAAAPVKLPPTSQFEHAISGSGLVEANTRNIAVGSHLSGIVKQLFVAEGDSVEKDAPLFKLDDRSARAEISTAESNLSVARAQLAEAQVSLADQRDQYARVSKLKEGVAVTADRVSRLRFAAQTATTRVNVAKAAVDEAEARLKEANVTLEKTTVTAPITGKVLKLNTRVGEFVQAGETNTPPLVVGNDTPLHVRVSLDENDLWRFSKEAKATGSLRSNRNVTFPLTFVRLEPYVVPKTSLTGATSEKVDTRVLEVVYRVEATDAPVYIGQQVDVFIEETTPSQPSAPADASAVTMPAPTEAVSPAAGEAPAAPEVSPVNPAVAVIPPPLTAETPPAAPGEAVSMPAPPSMPTENQQ